MVYDTISNNPLGTLALSCSGGGYRASAFHLGAMSYLNHLEYDGNPILEKVKLISTVSGGTITGVLYAIGKHKNQSFTEIYDTLFERLQNLDLLKLAFEKLNGKQPWHNPNKTKNLINAFSELYEEYLTNGATLGDLFKGSGHLDLVIFNSTEFNNAIDFRFRNSHLFYSGNNLNKIPQGVDEEIKLSDVIAASSCFPGGFEPILWPHDFIHEKSPAIRQFSKTHPPTGLMDGGIYDNQGIESILNYKKGESPPHFDLIFISDVASPYMEPFKPYQAVNKSGFYKWSIKDFQTKTGFYSLLVNLILGVFIIGVFGIHFFNHQINPFWSGVFMGLGIGLLIILVLKLLISLWVATKFNHLKNKVVELVPPFFRDKLANLKIEELTLEKVEPLFRDRLNSLVSLLLNVFLTVVRRLNYKFLYNNDNYTYRRISNLIKELTEVDFNNAQRRQKEGGIDPNLEKNSVLMGNYSTVVGEKLSKIATEASSFGTTLWFTDQDGEMLKKIIITGQATACYNMVDYLEKVIYEAKSGFKSLPQNTQQLLQTTLQTCKSDWEKFKTKPEFMLRIPPGL